MRVDAEPVGDRRVDLQRLLGDPVLLFRRQRLQRLHVVQPVGELHQDDADVLHHREHHLAEALRLRLGAAGEGQLVELADAVHQAGDLGAEPRLDLGLGGGRVLDHVVQQRRRDRLVVEVELREDARHRHRVGDVGLARLALLSLVGSWR